jgi:hypothetical protein
VQEIKWEFDTCSCFGEKEQEGEWEGERENVEKRRGRKEGSKGGKKGSKEGRGRRKEGGNIGHRFMIREYACTLPWYVQKYRGTETQWTRFTGVRPTFYTWK